jgi:alcohol dehydrogenase
MSKMRAAYISKYGRTEKLIFGEVDIPLCGDTDVLVEIHAASLNPLDFKIRDGKIKFLRSYSFPLILGHDLAGVVSAVGNKVTRFKIGDKVYSRPRNGRTGSLAQFIAIDEKELAHMPKNLSYEEAASIPLVGLTSWQALFDIAGMRRGDRVFVQAGAGGIGTFAIQLAKRFGAHVITTTSSRNIDFVRSLGADEIIDYKTQKFEDVLQNIDIVFDTLGREALYKSFQVLRPGGWVVSISGDPDQRLAQDMQLNFLKREVLRLVGYKANKLAAKAKANYRFIFMKPSGSQLAQISQLIEAGEIKPVIDKVFSFQEAQKAMDYLELGHSRGKIVIKIHEYL